MKLEARSRLQATTIKARDLTFAKIKELIGPSLSLHEFDVDNGFEIKAQVKTTTRNGLVKTAYLHVTLIHPNGHWEYYRENAKGIFNRINYGRK